MEQLNEVFRLIGLPPELFGSAVAAGLLLRYARGMVRWFGPSHTYGAALLLGIAGGAWRAWRVGVDGAPAATLALAGAILLVQMGVQKLASSKIPVLSDLLPADNAWAGDPKTKETP